MGMTTGIPWTDATVNFWWGCTKVGPGCDHCYAEATDRRAGGDHWGQGVDRRKIKGARQLIHRLDNAYADWAADSICRRENAKAFGLPRPAEGNRRRVFIQSMADLFDLEVPAEWFDEAWGLIVACDRLAIQICTKRISAVEKRLAEISYRGWPQHVGLMITVVNQQEADRDIPRLLALKEKRCIPWVGLSIEPMLGPIQLDEMCDGHKFFDALRGNWWHEPPEGIGLFERGHAKIDWVIVGGESSRDARPMQAEWARSLRDQCKDAGVPFFFKQWGTLLPAGQMMGDGRIWQPSCGSSLRGTKAVTGHFLDGVEHRAFPKALR